MTGRHAAPRDEAFDQLERDRAGAHRADIEVPLGPDDGVAAAPAAPAKPTRARKAAAKTTPTTTSKTPSTTSKRASKS